MQVEGLRSQLAGVEHTLEETTRTYKGVIQDLNKQLVAAQAALREAELKGQQKRVRWICMSCAPRMSP